MTPEDFTAWLAHIGWSKRRAARELGCSFNSVAAWCAKGAPPYIGYACAALAWGLRAWKLPAEDNGAPIPVRNPDRIRRSPV
jgi:hypothetical protein